MNFLFVIFICAYLDSIPITEAFAAANKGGGKKKNKKSANASSTNRGFGAPPPTLAETLATFRTRLPENASEQPCPCATSSGATYKDCCQPLHLGQQTCLKPLDVLKSRYSAFCYRDIGYIIATTHPKCRDYQEDRIAWAKDLNKNGMFDSFDFIGLEVLKDEDGDNNDHEAYIEFQVRMKGREGNLEQRSVASIAGEETLVTERSQFLRDPETGIWTYSGGDVRSGVEGLEDVTLNT
jgi:SEC-C motif-containing protein